MLMVFFTSAYFLVFFVYLIDLIFRNTLNPLTDILAVVCWIIALVVSVGLSDFTVKKIRKHNK